MQLICEAQLSIDYVKPHAADTYYLWKVMVKLDEFGGFRA